MTLATRYSSHALIAFAISLAGLGLLPVLLINSPPTIIIPWQTHVIGGLFALICASGIIAGVAPRHCSFSSRPRRSNGEAKNVDSQSTLEIHKRGHHPTCEPFAGHILKLRRRTVCAGCMGLVTGGVVAIIGTVLVFFFGWHFVNPYPIFWSGIFLLLLGLLQHPIYRLLSVSLGSVRFIVNVLFVLGPFLLLASIVQISNNLSLALYLLLLTLYWIYTRIVMSQRSHRLICRRCTENTCALREG